MSRDENEFPIRRILVALDTSTHSLAALKAAAELAAGMEAELLGLFVEDINLLQLAGLPFARELRYPSAVEERLDRSRMERELRVQAEQARRALMVAAERAQVRCAFRVVRGQVTEEILAAALEADLLSLGKASRPLTRRARLGSTALALATCAPRAVLLVEHGIPFKQPITVVYNGSRTARKALAAAARLAGADGNNLTVLILADTAAKARRLEEQVADLLQEKGSPVRYRWLESADLLSLVQALREEGSGGLVMDAQNPLLQEGKIRKLLHEIDCPVLLVR